MMYLVQKNKECWQQAPRLVNIVIWVFVAEVILPNWNLYLISACLVISAPVFVGLMT